MRKMKLAIIYDGCHAEKGMKLMENHNYGRIDFTKLNEELCGKVSADVSIDVNVIFSGWYQGIESNLIEKGFKINDSEDTQLLKNALWKHVNERSLRKSLFRAGVETVFLERNFKNEEKGIDVAITVSAMNRASEGVADGILLVTNDADYAPLIQNLKKKGLSIFVASFVEENRIAQQLKRLATNCYSLSETDKVGYYLEERTVEYG